MQLQNFQEIGIWKAYFIQSTFVTLSEWQHKVSPRSVDMFLMRQTAVQPMGSQAGHKKKREERRGCK